MDPLTPIDAYLDDLATRQHAGLRHLTVDEVCDRLLDIRNEIGPEVAALRSALELMTTGEMN